MGYEIKIFVVHNIKLIKEDGYCSVIGMLDLSKPPVNAVMNLMGSFRKKQESIPEENKFYFYDTLGENECKISKDRYGENIVRIPILDFICALKQDNAFYRKQNSGHGYRRFDTAIRFLKSFVYHDGWKGQLKETFVLAYGH